MHGQFEVEEMRLNAVLGCAVGFSWCGVSGFEVFDSPCPACTALQSQRTAACCSGVCTDLSDSSALHPPQLYNNDLSTEKVRIPYEGPGFSKSTFWFISGSAYRHVGYHKMSYICQFFFCMQYGFPSG